MTTSTSSSLSGKKGPPKGKSVHPNLWKGGGWLPARPIRWTIVCLLLVAVALGAYVVDDLDAEFYTPVITHSLISRLRSRDEISFPDRLLSAMRNQFGGHAIKKSK